MLKSVYLMLDSNEDLLQTEEFCHGLDYALYGPSPVLSGRVFEDEQYLQPYDEDA